MTAWVAKIKGFRRWITDDGTPDGVKTAAGGACEVLREYLYDVEKSSWREIIQSSSVFAIDELGDLCSEFEWAGKDGDCDYFNEVLSAFYDWCDEHRVWVEMDGGN